MADRLRKMARAVQSSLSASTSSAVADDAAPPHSGAEMTLTSLPDEMLLLVIKACNEPIRVCNGLPLFEHVKGLAGLSKGVQQQLHRLRPLVGVPSLAVMQRPAHGPWRVMLQHEGKLTKAVVQLAQQGRVHSIHYGKDHDKPQQRTLLAPSVAKRVVPALLGEGCSLLQFSLLGVELNGTWATSLGEQPVCSAVLQRLFLNGCGLSGPLPSVRLPALQKLDLSFNHLTGGLEPLSACTSLRTLSLFRNQLTGTLEPLRGMTALEEISLQSNKLTGGLEPLRGCTALGYLVLDHNPVTGDLGPLWGCASLSCLFLEHTRVLPTSEDTARFTNKCAVYHV